MVFILVVFPQVKNSYTKQLALLAFFQENVSNLNQVKKKKKWCIYLFINNLKLINISFFILATQGQN